MPEIALHKANYMPFSLTTVDLMIKAQLIRLINCHPKSKGRYP